MKSVSPLAKLSAFIVLVTAIFLISFLAYRMGRNNSISSKATKFRTNVGVFRNLLTDDQFAKLGEEFLMVVSGDQVFLNVHMKDYKQEEAVNKSEFIKQMDIIKAIANSDLIKGKEIVVAGDFNTHFENDASNKQVIKLVDKKFAGRANEDKKLIFEFGVDVEFKPCPFPTSNKMRSWHTVQLEKALVPISATIDHIFTINNKTLNDSMTPKAFVINEKGKLVEITNKDTLTTGPKSIADHALLVRGPFATYNVKMGRADEKGWAEFVNPASRAFLEDEAVKKLADDLLMKHFNTSDIDALKKADSSQYRCVVFDNHLKAEEGATVQVSGNNIVVAFKNIEGKSYKLKFEDDQYALPDLDDAVTADQKAWLDSLIKCLNVEVEGKGSDPKTPKKRYPRAIFMDKAYNLINFWTEFMNNEDIKVNNKSIKQMYQEWHHSSTQKKIPIPKVIEMAKNANKNLKVMFLQEVPADEAEITAMKEELKSIAEIDFTAGADKKGAIVFFKNS